jgi:hypothetical protein
VRKLERQDVLVRLTTSLRAREKSPQLLETVETHLLTSMVDPIRCPRADVVERYRPEGKANWVFLGKQDEGCSNAD